MTRNKVFKATEDCFWEESEKERARKERARKRQRERESERKKRENERVRFGYDSCTTHAGLAPDENSIIWKPAFEPFPCSQTLSVMPISDDNDIN